MPKIVEQGWHEIDGERFDWTYDDDGLVEVSHPVYGSKTTQKGGLEAEQVALLLASELNKAGQTGGSE